MKKSILIPVFTAVIISIPSLGSAQVKNLKGVRDNISDEVNKDIAWSKYEIDKVMQHPDTRDMCAAWAWKGVVYAEVANSTDSNIIKLDTEHNAAKQSGEAFVKFFACSEDEQDKYDAKRAASSGVVNAIFACWNAGVAVSSEKGKFAEVRDYMTLVEKMIPYDKEEQAKKYRVTTEQALFMIWRAAWMDSLVNEEIVYLEKLMSIPSYMNADVFIRMAEIMSSRKEYDKGLEYLEKGKIKIPQKAGDFLDMQINIEIERENMPALLITFEEAIKNNPDNPQYYFSRGVAYHKLKEDEIRSNDGMGRNTENSPAMKYYYSQGLKDYQKALELDPSYFAAMKNEAILFFDSANYIYKLRTRVKPEDYEKTNQLAVAIYKQALERFEKLRQTGYIKDEELIDLLKDMKTICIKINDQEGRLKYDSMMRTERRKLEQQE